MAKRLPVYIGQDAISELVNYCKSNDLFKFALIADQNTYAAFGNSVEQALKASPFDVLSIILQGDEIIADEHYIVQALTKLDRQNRLFLAVGSGTLTDITRFISHRVRTSFISLPTAPSVDGFTSIGAPLVLGGLKQTIICQPPMAVFADLATLTSAPQRLIAAGFGDMVGKMMSVADWKLGYVIWDEPYDEQIAGRFLVAAKLCTDSAREIGERTEAGVRTLIAGLVESGFGMLDFGNSTPASGAEHHMSHCWEMKLLNEKKPAMLHGAKVAVASILTAKRYQVIGSISRDQLGDLLQWSRLPSRDQQVLGIQAAYGPITTQIIKEQSPFLNMTEQTFEKLRQRIIDRWPEVQQIAHAVPKPEQLIEWLNQVGAPIDASGIGLGDQDVELVLEFGHYLRNRFTINKLWFILGTPP
jgi:glycerol-1-phosphate dehydrogenase [NAD(P)+]